MRRVLPLNVTRVSLQYRWYGRMTSLERHEELWCITGPRSESILRWIQWRSLLYASWMSFPCHVRPVSHTKINWDYQLTSHQPLRIQISLCSLSKVISQHLCTESVCARARVLVSYIFLSILQKLPLYFALQQLLTHHARRVARGEKDDRRGFQRRVWLWEETTPLQILEY